ncbi:MAG: hypothetical protein H0W43_00310 [Chthoniobacterales bacterium]|jgi:hypothetical protein|nr:hypothetical protein [Chthoniobacterales bacterium]
MEFLSILGLLFIAALFGGAGYFSYEKDWRFGFYVSLIVCASFICLALPATRSFLRTTAWVAFVTGLEATGQGLVRLNSTIDNIRAGMKRDQSELDKVQQDTRQMQVSLHDAQQALEKQQQKTADLDQLLNSIYEARNTELSKRKLIPLA